jgi:hypothetical protein
MILEPMRMHNITKMSQIHLEPVLVCSQGILILQRLEGAQKDEARVFPVPNPRTGGVHGWDGSYRINSNCI